MDPDSLVPADGGSLLRPVVQPVSEPVATFTQARAMHPDEIWSPRGSELAPPARPMRPPINYELAPSEHPVQREHMGAPVLPHEEIARAVRAAVRPGMTLA